MSDIKTKRVKKFKCPLNTSNTTTTDDPTVSDGHTGDTPPTGQTPTKTSPIVKPKADCFVFLTAKGEESVVSNQLIHEVTDELNNCLDDKVRELMGGGGDGCNGGDDGNDDNHVVPNDTRLEEWMTESDDLFGELDANPFEDQLVANSVESFDGNQTSLKRASLEPMVSQPNRKKNKSQTN